MFKSKRRIASAWAKGLMFGKAVGKRDERDRISTLIEQYFPPCSCSEYEPPRICIHSDIAKELIALIEGKHND